jgi:hypothetical protein
LKSNAKTLAVRGHGGKTLGKERVMGLVIGVLVVVILVVLIMRLT